MSTPAEKPKPQPKKWLVVYNSVSSSLWSVVFFNTVFLGLALGQPHVYEKTHKLTTAIQTLAVIEVVNAAAGIVRASLFTTAMQVYSRLLVVWGVWISMPESPANVHWSYISVSIAWSLSEIIKYSYHTSSLAGSVPHWLVYLRYTAFIVLYPVGVGSEMAIMYLSLDEAQKTIGPLMYYVLVANLVFYLPGLFHLYTHMLRQRKKVLGKPKAESKKTE